MMNRFFTLLLAASCLTAIGQVPDYVPADGLVGYYPFDGNVLNMVSSDDGLSTDVSFDLDRFGQEGRALAIVSENSEVSLPLSYLASGGEPRTISYWLRRADNASDGEPFTGVVYNGQSCGQKSFGCGANIYTKGVSVDFSCGALTYGHAASHQECGWNHIVIVVPDISNPVLQDIIVYENGEMLEFLTGTNVTSLITTVHGEYTIGGTYGNWGDRLFDAADFTCGAPLIDDLAFYDRALSPDEVNQLFSWTPAIGCTDVEACNYDAEAVLDDDSCMDCSLFAERCGPGTAWDDETQMCIVANPSDSNFDGCVQLNDLLDLLSAYGDCGAEETPWQCGDPLEYQGYDYETVQIGEQCWFAENLRAENYATGDPIPSSLNQLQWSLATAGASDNYGLRQGVQCQDYADDPDYDIQTCNPEVALLEYGLLYNAFAMIDSRGLCPTGWIVPADEEWNELEIFLGMDPALAFQIGDRGTTHGAQLRSSYGWRNGANGSDDFGFSVVAGGLTNNGGSYSDAGRNGQFWSTSQRESGEPYWYIRDFQYGAGSVKRNDTSAESGLSIRCIKDSE